jgi:hypothetical protein
VISCLFQEFREPLGINGIVSDTPENSGAVGNFLDSGFLRKLLHGETPMNSSEELRRHAVECVQMAKFLRNRKIRLRGIASPKDMSAVRSGTTADVPWRIT